MYSMSHYVVTKMPFTLLSSYNSSCSIIARFTGQYNAFTSKLKYHESKCMKKTNNTIFLTQIYQK